MQRRGVCKILGGKTLLAPQIAQAIDAIPHHTYLEPYVGGASVFMTKAKSRYEILNDIDAELTTLLRCAAHHPQALATELAKLHAGRLEYKRLAATDPATLTDLQRAARTFTLRRLTYGGDITTVGGGRLAGVQVTSWQVTVSLYAAWLATACGRLADALIENLPATEAIRRYDSPTTLTYADPPYIATTGYAHPFTDDDHRQLADQLHTLTGRFLLTINNHPLARELYADCQVTELAGQWMTRGGGKHAHVTELLIAGPPRPRRKRPSKVPRTPPKPTTKGAPKRRPSGR